MSSEATEFQGLIKILNAQQVRDVDARTIEHEPIASLDLMERASRVFTDWFTGLYPEKQYRISLLCGTGNNGGDGLAVARMLAESGYKKVKVLHCTISKNPSKDFLTNQKRFNALKSGNTAYESLHTGDEMPDFSDADLIIDALLGSGLSRPLEGFWAESVQYINGLSTPVISIDIPSGLAMDFHTDIAIHASHCLSFELPKLPFFLPENAESIRDWEMRTIGLDQEIIGEFDTDYFYLTPEFGKQVYSPRPKFSHKGTAGHALLICGSAGMAGAAVLAAKGALRGGAGLVSVHVPQNLRDIIQTSVPEAMVSTDTGDNHFSELPPLDKYKAIGIGPGLGTHADSSAAFEALLRSCKCSLVIDADALNILAAKKEMLNLLPGESILTPHPGEFDRLFGPSSNHRERLEKARESAINLGVNIVLKGAYTAIINSEGKVVFNCSGNPGMATGGSGDVLTGLLTALLCQGYNPRIAAILGVYMHGVAGDFASHGCGEEAVIAGDIAAMIKEAWKTISEDI